MINLRETLSPYYLSRFNKIEKIMYNIAGKTKIFFPTYTNHGTDHLKNVEKYVNLMINDEIKENMTYEEKFFLLCGIWLHDIGMVPKDEEELNLFKSLTPKEREKFTKNVRDIHHIRSSNYIKENHDELGINKLEAKIIGQIAKGHREFELNNLDDINYNGSLIRIPCLASILRLADECDVSKDRESSLSDIDVDEETRRHYYNKIKLVNHVWFDYEKGIIFVSCITENEEDIDLVNEVVDEIKNKLEQTTDYLVDFGINFYDVQLDDHSDKIYEKLIISKIADENFEIEDLISNELSRNKILEILENLDAEGVFEENDYSNGFVDDFDVYKSLFEKFEGPQNLKNFFFTEYSQKMVDSCFKDLTDKFKASFGKGRKNRIAILKNSPTAFHLALSFDEIIGDENFKINSSDDGSTIVDHLLLMSLFNDIKYYKDLINFKEIEEFIGDLIKDESEIIGEINKYSGNKINKDNDSQFYKIYSFENSTYPPKSKWDDKYHESDRRRITIKCGNIPDFNYRMIMQLFDYRELDLIVCDKEYENISITQRFNKEYGKSITSSSEELPFNFIIKYLRDHRYYRILCTFYPKSDKINDLLSWSKFKKNCSGKNIIFKKSDRIKFECKFPKININPRLIEFYEIINRLNNELDLEMTHERNYIINNKEYEYAELIDSFLENRQINIPSINVHTSMKISELKEILHDNTIPIEIGYNHFPINILGNNIDLGKYTVKLLAGKIINKEELQELTKTNELTDIVNVTLIIKNHDSDDVLLDFN